MESKKQSFLNLGNKKLHLHGSYLRYKNSDSENIEFFSRDSTRIGMNLEFEYSLENGNWNHKGFSSKGNPINEIWSKRPTK